MFERDGLTEEELKRLSGFFDQRAVFVRHKGCIALLHKCNAAFQSSVEYPT